MFFLIYPARLGIMMPGFFTYTTSDIQSENIHGCEIPVPARTHIKGKTSTQVFGDYHTPKKMAS
jgi:hypothetical protein